MNIFRSSIESWMNFIIYSKGSTKDSEELAGVLDPVKKGVMA
jgi:hypothetical protein